MSIRYTLMKSITGWLVLTASLLTACQAQLSDQVDFSTPTVTPEIVVQNAATTAIATISREPEQPMISSGVDARLVHDNCFDLDAGVSLASQNPDCDFVILSESESDSQIVDFSPLSRASFDFEAVYWEPPGLTGCRSAPSLANRAYSITTARQYYVCFQTSKGYFGYLFLKSYDQQGFLLDWVTYDSYAGLIAPEPVVVQTTLPPEPVQRIYSQGTNQLLGFTDGLELDAGIMLPAVMGVSDLTISVGQYDAQGVLQSLLIEPALKTSLANANPFTAPPSKHDCQALNAYESRPFTAPAERQYLCFQTDHGRLGYLYLHETNPGIGIRIDWVTWAGVEEELSADQGTSASTTVISDQALLLGNLGTPEAGVLAPGQHFKKTWQVANSGTTTWNGLYSLVWAGGSKYGGPERILLKTTLAFGKSMKITLDLIAPDIYGTYIGEYLLENQNGERFGLGEHGDALHVLINVGEPGLTLAEGNRVILAEDACFDLDLGAILSEDPACDFNLHASLDPQLAEFSSIQAAFDFETLFMQPPRLAQCQHVRLSSGDRMLGMRGWYVCYKTNQGRYGWFIIYDVSPGQIAFDWKTFQ